jgi:hypothetical protein
VDEFVRLVWRHGPAVHSYLSRRAGYQQAARASPTLGTLLTTGWTLGAPRPREDWIATPIPPIIADDAFEAANRVSRVNRDNSKWSPRHVGVDEAWLLRALVSCDACGV